ncbi:MAG: V-type ATP synthase subunit I [Planctomycetota bacterium]
MKKVQAVARNRDRDQLLERVRELGIVHLTPVDPAQAVINETTINTIKNIERAVQILSNITPAGQTPDMTAEEATRAVLDIQQRSAEQQNRLATLHRQLEQLAIWGDVELKQFQQLHQAGVDVQFFSVPTRDLHQIEAECVQVIGTLPAKRSLVAVIDRNREPKLPDQAVNIPLPPADAPAIRAEAAQIDAAIKQNASRLAQLAHLTSKMQAEINRLQQQSDYTLAVQGAFHNQHLFAIQGWVPAEKSESITAKLEQENIDAVVRLFEPAPQDEPPTMIRYPAWTKPIEGLFDILGSLAGYREFDVAAPFMIALPIFAAMLISDGGYGAILLFVPLLLYKKMSKMLGARFTQLLIVVGAVSLVWGLLTSSFFGCTLFNPPIPVNLSEQSRFLLMKISFVLGAIHLSIAQLWRALAVFPNLQFLNRIGWAVFIWGMLGVVLFFVLKAPMGWDTPWPYFLTAGAALAILFACPSWNIAKMIGLGIADFPLSLLSAFSDVISYVRLMAVGLASSVLATNFNEMALEMNFWPLTIVILIFGHGLNLGLALIALFAHGVRLNMLEFSNNLGMQWTGYPYNPFLKRMIQEQET